MTKRKHPKRASRVRPANAGALGAMNEALMVCGENDEIGPKEGREALIGRVHHLRSRLEAANEERHNMVRETDTLRMANANLLREVAEWKLRFDRLLDAMQHR